MFALEKKIIHGSGISPSTRESQRLIVACGGTGGHVFPGVAMAHELRRRGHKVELWLAGRDIEQCSCLAWDGPTENIPARGLPSGFSWRTAWSGVMLLAATGRCIRRMRRGRRPAAVLAMGGYASVGPGLAAVALRIPLVLHESNAVPGRAISLLSRWATTVGLAFPEAAAMFPEGCTAVTGFPLRESDRTGIDDFGGTLPHPAKEHFTVLVTGGSQGAQRLNEMVTESLCLLSARGIRFQVIHLAGRREEAMVRTRYQQAGVPAAVFGFLQRMDRAYEAADFAICRAGAATCAELAAAGVPALLIPLPSAARNHQTFNAMAVARDGAADLVAQEALQPSWLADYLAEHISAPENLELMRNAALRRAVINGAALTADIVEAALPVIKCDGDK